MRNIVILLLASSSLVLATDSKESEPRFSIGLGVLAPSYSQKLAGNGRLDFNQDAKGFSYLLNNVQHLNQPSSSNTQNDYKTQHQSNAQQPQQHQYQSDSIQNSDTGSFYSPQPQKAKFSIYHHSHAPQTPFQPKSTHTYDEPEQQSQYQQAEQDYSQQYHSEPQKYQPQQYQPQPQQYQPQPQQYQPQPQQYEPQPQQYEPQPQQYEPQPQQYEPQPNQYQPKSQQYSQQEYYNTEKQYKSSHDSQHQPQYHNSEQQNYQQPQQHNQDLYQTEPENDYQPEKHNTEQQSAQPRFGNYNFGQQIQHQYQPITQQDSYQSSYKPQSITQSNKKGTTVYI